MDDLRHGLNAKELIQAVIERGTQRRHPHGELVRRRRIWEQRRQQQGRVSATTEAASLANLSMESPSTDAYGRYGGACKTAYMDPISVRVG